MSLLHSEFGHPEKEPVSEICVVPFSNLAIELDLIRLGLGATFTFELHCSLLSTLSLLLFRFT